MREHDFRFALLGILIMLFAVFTNSTPLVAGTQPPMPATAGIAGAPQANMVRIALGGWNHTCAGSADGSLMCWGSNGDGELGDGTATTPRPSPVAVIGLTGATVIGAGEKHTCAMTTGGAKCWGRNSGGELGMGSVDSLRHPTPEDVHTSSVDSTPLSGVIAITGGENHTCALMATGTVKCWGRNPLGQLGIGTSDSNTHPAPEDVTGVSGATAIASGGSHTCAVISPGGTVKCWGTNVNGELGIGVADGIPHPTPVEVTGLTNATALGAGDHHTCAVVGGAAKCWGWGTAGQLGDGFKLNRLAPVQVTGLTSDVTAIAGAQLHTCALTTGGAVKCWGRNTYGQLGDGGTSEALTPVQVLNLSSGAIAIDTGHYHSCALLSTGVVKCWGYNSAGQLGIGTTDVLPHSAPVVAALPIPTTTTVTSSANPAVVGQTVVFTATVSAVLPGTPTGNVTFMDGATPLGTGTLNASAQATRQWTAAGVGAHSITAVYAGAVGFDPSTSPVLSQTVNQASTLTALSAPPNLGLGQPNLFTATVTVVAPGAGAPTGTVTFKDAASTIAGCGTRALSGAGAANCTASVLSAGSHAITATYNGNPSFAQSTSAALNLVIWRLYSPLIER